MSVPTTQQTPAGKRPRVVAGKTYFVSPAHPIAEHWPWLTDEQLLALADDIKRKRQKLPIKMLPDGRILDGRNRELACLIAGVEPLTEVVKIPDAEVPEFVASLNGHRRSLTPGQRAIVAARYAGHPREEAAGSTSARAKHISHPEAAKMLGVGERSVSRASLVITFGCPDLIAAVEDGTVGLTIAEDVAKLTFAEQAVILSATDRNHAARQALAAKGLTVGGKPATPAESSPDILTPVHEDAARRDGPTEAAGDEDTSTWDDARWGAAFGDMAAMAKEWWESAAPGRMLVTLPVGELTLDPEIEVRTRPSGRDADHLADLTDMLRENPALEMTPVRAYFLPDGRKVLVDGFYRTAAYRDAGRKTIPVELYSGDWDVAEFASFFVNWEHDEKPFLPYTRDEKRGMVCVLVRVTERRGEEWTDQEIAEHIGCSRALVAEVRANPDHPAWARADTRLSGLTGEKSAVA